VSQYRIHVGVAFRPSPLDREPGEDHDRQPALTGGRRQGRRAGRVSEGFAAQKRDAFNSVLKGLVDPTQDVGQTDRLAAGERDELRVAAAGAAERTALEPEREPLTRALGLGTRDDLRDLEGEFDDSVPSKPRAKQPWAFRGLVHYSARPLTLTTPVDPSSPSIVMLRSRKSWMTAALVVRCRVTSET
jgi:hypothetical protein